MCVESDLPAIEIPMKRIGLFLIVVVLAAACHAVGQQVPNVQNQNPITALPQRTQSPSEPKDNLGTFPRNDSNVNFTGQATTGQRSNIAFVSGETVPDSVMPIPTVPGGDIPANSGGTVRALPTLPTAPAPAALVPTPVRLPQTTNGVSAGSEVPANDRFTLQQPFTGVPTNNGAPANNVAPAPAPAQAIQQVAQNQSPVTQSYPLRLSPQIFERNLVEKLGSRFVPVRGGAEASGISRYTVPGRDGTAVELVVNQQQGVVTITGSPRMVEASMQIVRLLDIPEVPGGAVTRFVPVQQSSMEPTRIVAGLVNQEMVRVAQAPPQQPGTSPAVPAPAVPPVPGATDAEAPSLGRVIGNVSIEVIPDLNTVMIQGPPGDVAVVLEMLRQLEALSLENEPVIELIPMRHTDSLRISQLVQLLYQQVYLNRRGPVVMYALVKPNTILIIGRKESIDAAKELIAKLDTPVNPNANFQIFTLKYAAAIDLVTQINTFFTNRPSNMNQQMLAPMGIAVADQRTNALIVIANPRDIEEAAALIRQLDVPGPPGTSFLRTFPLRNALAADVVTTISNALSGQMTAARQNMLSFGTLDAEGNLVRSSILYNITITADARSNSVIVTAPPDTMSLVEALIKQLDQLPSVETKIRVFTLVNGDAFTLTTLLTNLFVSTAAVGATTPAVVRPGFEDGDSILVAARFQADTRTNSIIAIGGEGDLAVAEALLLRLDAENLNNRKIFTMKLVNVPAEELAPILTTYVTNERQILIQNSGTFLPQSPIEQYLSETTIAAEPISNSLIISTTPQYYEQIRQIVMDLDERPLMVAIDVLIAEVILNRTKEREVELGLQDSILYGITPPTTAFSQFLGTSNVGAQGITRLGASPEGNGFKFSAGSESVNLFIRALETRSKTQVLSRPRLVTLHNRRASIVVGSNVPFAAGGTTNNIGNFNTTTDWRDVGTILDVTPRIMPDGMIAIAIYVEQSSIGAYIPITSDLSVPEIKNTNAATTLNAMDGETVIFAGLISETKETTNRSVPGLNKIPVIKHLFEFDQQTCKRSELLIVMTPRIIRTQQDLAMLNQQERERMHWCAMDVVKLTGNTEMRRRSDEWLPNEVRHTYGAPVLLNDRQLPPAPMFPVIETK